jgi:L-lactate dehydrogenase complex protein LldF
MLSRSALGSPITQITSHFRAPRPGTEIHVVLVDNGRSERLGMDDFWYSLKCIRCGACMNTCPVYRRSGGLSYGSTYSGPIGVIIDPTFNLRKYSSLPFASTLNGSCTSVCPVKIDIHEQIYKWRQIIAERHQLPMVKKEAMRHRRQGPVEPEAVPRRRRGRGRGNREAAALDRLQPVQRVGPAARGARGAAQTFRQWYLKHRGRLAMTTTATTVLARVRRNQPAWRELPRCRVRAPLDDPLATLRRAR